MKALLLDRPGPPETLRIGAVAAPVAGPGQVRVTVEACGLNPVDVGVARRGHPDWSWPHVLGLDVVGTIDQVGHGVVGHAVGERVAVHGDLRRRGGFAEHAVADAIAIARVPDGLDPAAAAALPCAGMTAYQALSRRLRVRPSQTVLVTGAAGGVGGFAVQLAASMGARVIATTSAGNADHVRRLGAHEVIDYRTESVVDRARELSGTDLDAVVDTVGAESASELLGVVSYGGGVAAVAGRPDFSAVPPFTTAPSIHEVALGAAYSHGRDGDRVDLARMLEALLAMVASADLDPRVARTVALAEVPQALAEISRGHVRGKLVYTAG